MSFFTSSRVYSSEARISRIGAALQLFASTGHVRSREFITPFLESEADAGEKSFIIWKKGAWNDYESAGRGARFRLLRYGKE